MKRLIYALEEICSALEELLIQALLMFIGILPLTLAIACAILLVKCVT